MIKASPNGGYITGWSLVNDKTGKEIEAFYQGSSMKRTGIPPLFPCWNDSGTDLRKHGFARDVEWKVVKNENDQTSMTIESRDIKDSISQEYPYDFSVRIDALSEANELYYSMTVKNLGQKDMPIAPAIHPYFAVNHGDKKVVKTKGIEGFNARTFDWDTAPPDNDYPYSKSAKIILPDREIEILDVSPTLVFKHMVVWSQPKSSPDFNFICFEPLTALAGAIKRREIVVRPGSSWEMRLKFIVRFR